MDHIEHTNGIQLGLSLSTEQIRNSSDCLIQLYKNFLLLMGCVLKILMLNKFF